MYYSINDYYYIGFFFYLQSSHPLFEKVVYILHTDDGGSFAQRAAITFLLDTYKLDNFRAVVMTFSKEVLLTAMKHYDWEVNVTALELCQNIMVNTFDELKKSENHEALDDVPDYAKGLGSTMRTQVNTGKVEENSEFNRTVRVFDRLYELGVIEALIEGIEHFEDRVRERALEACIELRQNLWCAVSDIIDTCADCGKATLKSASGNNGSREAWFVLCDKCRENLGSVLSDKLSDKESLSSTCKANLIQVLWLNLAEYKISDTSNSAFQLMSVIEDILSAVNTKSDDDDNAVDCY